MLYTQQGTLDGALRSTTSTVTRNARENAHEHSTDGIRIQSLNVQFLQMSVEQLIKWPADCTTNDEIWM